MEVTYTVARDAAERFVAAMRPVGLSRRRTGAEQWHLYRDAADADRYVEVFRVPSWSEHLRQHDGRTTGYDAQLLDSARSLVQGSPQVRHLLPPSAPAGPDSPSAG